jgi:hypothetical protein
MRPVSERFLETLRGSHLAVFRARVTEQFLIGTNPVGTEIPVLGGDVKLSASATVRSTLSLRTAWEWPRREGDLITPYGNEVYVERGIAYGNGQREWVGLGYFRIDTPEQDEAPDGEITISGQDRMAGLVDARFEVPQQFPATWTRGDVVGTLIWGVYNWAGIIEWDDPVARDTPIGRSIIAEQDRAGTLMELLTSIGKIGFWDHRGIFVIKTPPATTGAPVWTVDAGEDGVLVRMSRALTREGVHNAWVVTGEAGDTTAPARGVAYNLDPTSPTYYRGRFGPVPGFYSSPFVTTNAQATAAATTLLRKELGLPYQVKLASVPNPALEPYDVIEARYPKRSRSRSLVAETHVVDNVTIPLVPDSPVELDTRQQQVELIGGSA